MDTRITFRLSDETDREIQDYLAAQPPRRRSKVIKALLLRAIRDEQRENERERGPTHIDLSDIDDMF